MAYAGIARIGTARVNDTKHYGSEEVICDYCCWHGSFAIVIALPGKAHEKGRYLYQLFFFVGDDSETDEGRHALGDFVDS